ncbi:MAG: LysR family transcriptional regulator [Clostridia bacterium]|nr:LysR family transcriptional regulator [Clostridia bacterium]
MDLQQLRYLVTISKTLNFSKAAEELFISQPTLSHQIRRLEEELGVRLLERSTRNVELTPIGRECVNLAERMVDLSDQIVQITQEESRRFSNRLNIGVLAVFPQVNISAVIAEFQVQHLNETIHMHFDWSTALMDRLQRKKVDVIISNIDMDTISNKMLEKLEIHPFLTDRLYLVVNESSPLAQRDTVGLEEVLSQQLFMPGQSSSANQFFVKAVTSAGYQMPEAMECPSITSVFNFVMAGNGASVLSKHVAQSYMKPGIKMVAIEPEIKSYVAIITRKELLKRTLVKEFIRFFLEHSENVDIS